MHAVTRELRLLSMTLEYHFMIDIVELDIFKIQALNDLFTSLTRHHDLPNVDDAFEALGVFVA